MSVPELSQEIVNNRRDKAPQLKKIIDTAIDFQKRLQNVSDSIEQLSDLDTPELKRSRNDISENISKLDDLVKETQIRFDRFTNGLITVSLAGLEKAGKTTFLKSLTGIEFLPAFDERCTAVCCEIHFSGNRSDFDIDFYTETEFMDRVIRPALETISLDLPESMKNRLTPPALTSEFVNLRLPDPEQLAGGTTAYKLLKDLRQLQKNFSVCRSYLGREPLLRRPLEELSDWVSHKQFGSEEADESGNVDRGRHLARVAAAKVCRIFTSFDGGTPHLRWIDTPGVDDPNRRARDLTLSTIARDTDLIVVASRPASTPSPNESFHNFWDSVSRQPDEIDLLSRLLFLLNWDRRVDPDSENVKVHRKYLVDAGVPQNVFIGPFEATRKEDAVELMNAVNDHLSRNLAAQDERVVQQFQARLKNIMARIRILHDNLAGTHPSDANQHDVETEEFHKWFHWYHGNRDTGFWTDLVESLDMSTRTIADDNRIHESESALKTIFAREVEYIQTQIPTPEELENYVVKHRGENPIPNGMRTISTLFSRLINSLSNEIQEFGPFMQDEMVKVLAQAGLDPLLEGKTSEDKLRCLLENFEEKFRLSPIVEVLKETLELPRNLKYVLRYELRGAVDFCDPTLWNEKEQGWERLKDMVISNNGEVDRLATFDTNKHPPVTDSREQDHALLKKIAANSIMGIQAVLNNERYLPRRIADDFMRDCRVRLCFAPESEQEWRRLLFPNRGVLLASTIGQIRAKSEQIQAFNLALNQLEARLP